MDPSRARKNTSRTNPSGWKRNKKLTGVRPQRLLLPPGGLDSVDGFLMSDATSGIDEILSSVVETSATVFTSALSAPLTRRFSSLFASSCRGSEDRLELDKSFLVTWGSVVPFGVLIQSLNYHLPAK